MNDVCPELGIPVCLQVTTGIAAAPLTSISTNWWLSENGQMK